MSTDPLLNFPKVFDQTLLPCAKKDNLVIKINLCQFHMIAQFQLKAWQKPLNELYIDMKKGKEHVQKVKKLLDLDGAAANRMKRCWGETYGEIGRAIKELMTDDVTEILNISKEHYFKSSDLIPFLYQKTLEHWEEYKPGEEKSFIQEYIGPAFTDRTVGPAMTSYEGFSIVERETLTKEDISYLGLQSNEVTSERNSCLDCGSWALLSFQIPEFAKEIKERYLRKKEGNAPSELSTPETIGYLKNRGFRLVANPMPGDLVMYREGIRKHSHDLNIPDRPLHFGILNHDGLVISKLGGCGGAKIYKHKIWQTLEPNEQEAIILRRSK